MKDICAAKRGRPRKLSPGQTEALTAAWQSHHAEKHHLAKTYGLTPQGARIVVKRHLREITNDQ